MVRIYIQKCRKCCKYYRLVDKRDASSNVKLADMGVCMVHTVEFMYCPLEVSLDELEQHT